MQQGIFFRRELSSVNVRMLLLQDPLAIQLPVLTGLSKSKGSTDFYYYCATKYLTNKCNVALFDYHSILLRNFFSDHFFHSQCLCKVVLTQNV